MSTMFELSKTILKKVSFDRTLFRKELIKALRWVNPEERLLLKIWCLTVFGYAYKDIILEIWNTSISLL